MYGCYTDWLEYSYNVLKYMLWLVFGKSEIGDDSFEQWESMRYFKHGNTLLWVLYFDSNYSEFSQISRSQQHLEYKTDSIFRLFLKVRATVYLKNKIESCIGLDPTECFVGLACYELLNHLCSLSLAALVLLLLGKAKMLVFTDSTGHKAGGISSHATWQTLNCLSLISFVVYI